MHRYLKLINILLAVLAIGLNLNAIPPDTTYPDSVDSRLRYEMVIEMPKAYLSGLLIMHRPAEGIVNGSIINEFGLSLMDFRYDEVKDKVKIINLTEKLNKWYIRRTLRSDLKKVLNAMKAGAQQYTNTRRKINYTFRLSHEAN